MSPARIEQAVRDAIVETDAAGPDAGELLFTVQGHTLKDILQGAADAIAEGMRTGCAGLDPALERASFGAVATAI